MTTTPKKAPTASEALRETAAYLDRWDEPLSAYQRGLYEKCIAAAERAEAEAAQEPGDSVEGLMRECVELAGAAVALTHDTDCYEIWTATAGSESAPDYYGPLKALRKLRDALTPAAPATDECLFQHTNNDEEINGES